MVKISDNIPSIDKFGHFIFNFQVGSGNSNFHDVYFSFATWWPFVLALTCWNVETQIMAGKKAAEVRKSKPNSSSMSTAISLL